MEFIFFEQLDSTNNYAKTLIQQGKAKSGQIIRTRVQSAGRGQSTNAWESEDGKNLTFSMIFYPEKIKPKNQFLISQAVSEGIVRYLKRIINNPSIYIKWPNDIYVGLKKIAGILIEHSIQGDQILFSVIGVGLNVNQNAFSKQIPNPVSLSLINKIQFDLEFEFQALITSIAAALEHLQIDGGLGTKDYYLQHLLFLDEEREYMLFGKKNRGKIIGINTFGFLQIQTKNGILFECNLKDVVYLL